MTGDSRLDYGEIRWISDSGTWTARKRRFMQASKSQTFPFVHVKCTPESSSSKLLNSQILEFKLDDDRPCLSVLVVYPSERHFRFAISELSRQHYTLPTLLNIEECYHFLLPFFFSFFTFFSDPLSDANGFAQVNINILSWPTQTILSVEKSAFVGKNIFQSTKPIRCF